jgi:hypothetical protein
MVEPLTGIYHRSMAPQEAAASPDVVPGCPICGEPTDVAHTHSKLMICVCRVCGTSITVPDGARLRALMFQKSAAKRAGSDVRSQSSRTSS